MTNRSYIGTKLISASPMTRLEYNDLRGWTVPADENPGDDGYLVEYLDGGSANHPDYTGYISWSPKEVFDCAYRPVSAMTFGDALVMLKDGKRVCRAGWNGNGMWIEMTGAVDYSFSELLPHFVIKNVSNSFSTWVPSINDCLAEDWMVVE